MGKEDCNNHEEHFQGENSDPGYGCSQQSESEFSNNCIALEMEDDSTKFSQASSRENRLTLNLNISLSENLEGKITSYHLLRVN